MFSYLRRRSQTSTEAARANHQAMHRHASATANAARAEQLASVPKPWEVPAFDDGGGYLWKAQEDGSFVCIGAPEGGEDSVGATITRQKQPDVHDRLDGMLDAQVEALVPSSPDIPLPSAPQWAPGGVLAEQPESERPVLDQVAEDLEPLLALDPIGAAQAWWAGEDEAEAEARQVPATPVTQTAPGEVVQSPVPPQPEQDLPPGVRDNLEAAIDLAETFNVPHEADLGTKAASPKEEILQGQTDDLDLTKCSFFTSMALSQAGWKLDELYLHGEEGIPVGYPESDGVIRLVDLYMVVNLFTEATAALVNPDLQETSTEEHAMSHFSDYEGRFLLSDAASFFGMEASQDHMFGAPAMAVSVGGHPVALHQRMPGDVQQSLDQGKTYGAKGHSSQIHSVRGPGTAALGQAGSPAVVRGGSEVALEGLEPGPYQVEGDLQLELRHDTGADQVLEFESTSAELIDSNTGRADGDSTGTEQETARGPVDPKRLRTARLPTSRWFGWAARPAEAPSLQEALEAP